MLCAGATHLQELTLVSSMSPDRCKAGALLPCFGCGESSASFKCTSCNRSDGTAALKGATQRGSSGSKHSARLSVASIHSMCTPLPAIQCCLVSLCGLRKLHMHGMRVLPRDLAFLGVVARALAGTLVHLTLCNFEDGINAIPAKEKARRYGLVHKEVFFKTVAMFAGLQTLQLPSLLSFLPGQEAMVLAPLKTMANLKYLIFSHEEHEECTVEALKKHVLGCINPDLRLLDSPCTICAGAVDIE